MTAGFGLCDLKRLGEEGHRDGQKTPLNPINPKPKPLSTSP